MKNSPETLNVHLGMELINYFPTLAYSMHFHTKIPESPQYSRNVLGLLSNGAFINEGLHDGGAELWIAPAEGYQGWDWSGREIKRLGNLEIFA